MQVSRVNFRKVLSLVIIGLLTCQVFAICIPNELLKTAEGQAADAPADIFSSKWRVSLAPGTEHGCGGVVTADINGDGVDEVFYAGGGMAYCLNGTDGRIIWQTSVYGGADQPQMADLNGDGIMDLMVVLNGVVDSAGLEVLYGQNGSRYWRRSGLGLECSCKPIAYDTNFDGFNEVFFSSTDVYHGENGTGRVTSMTHDGQIISQLFAWRPCAGGLSLADTDFDGNFELYMGDRHQYYGDGNLGRGLRAFDILPNVTLVSKWDRPEVLCSSAAPMIADVNKDGIADIISCHQGGGLGVFNASNGAPIREQLYISTSDGKAFPGHYQPTVCDIDYDGNLEILAADGYHPQRSTPDVVVWDLVTWKEDWRFPYVCTMGPKIGDVNGDGQLDVIVTSFAPDCGVHIYTWNKTTNTFSLLGEKSGLLANLGNAVMAEVDGDGLSEILISYSSGGVYCFDTIAPSFHPRPRSEVGHYSELRLGVAEYVQPPGPQPRVYNETPWDLSKTVSVSLSELSFDLNDPNGDPMNYTVTTSPNVGSGSGNNVGNGRPTVSVSGLNYETSYTWQVRATDGKYWTNRTYHFTVGPPSRPVVSNENPSNGAAEVSLLVSAVSFDLSDPDENLMNYTVTTSPNIGSASGTNVPGGHFDIPVSGIERNTTYSWQVRVTDGIYWTNKSFTFTTVERARWYDIGWQYRKKVIIDHTKVNGSLTDFTVLVSFTDSHVGSKAQPDGDDILFTDTDGVKVNHEIEFYNGSEGRLVAWVRVPALSTTVDTVLYMYYGNSGASSQENVTGTWDSNFMMVQHLSETSGTHYDSTINDNDGTASGALQGVAGKIDGADSFDGTDDYVSVTHSDTLAGYTVGMTVSIWVKLDDITTHQTILNEYEPTGTDRSWYVDFRGETSPKQFGFVASQSGVDYAITTASYAVTTSTWYYVAVVWQPSLVPKIYVNGQQLTASGSATSRIYNNVGVPVQFGQGWSGVSPERFIDGLIDEVCLSNSSRSASWIATCYNNQMNPAAFCTLGPEETPTIVSGMRVDPESTDATVGETFSVYVEVTNASDLYAWEFQLNYDPSILDLTATTIVTGGLNTPTQTYYSIIDETNGHLWWAVSTVHPTTTGISYSSHAIFEVQFRALAQGTSDLDLHSTFLSDSLGDPILHSVLNGSVTVTGTADTDLVVNAVTVLNQGCTLYANDTYTDGTTYCYPVEVTLDNIGTTTANSFYLKLEVYWINGSLSEASKEIYIPSLPPEVGGLVVNFTDTFAPSHMGFYRLTATVDSRNNVTERNESNNDLALSPVPVAVMGDMNGDREVNILDGVILSLAWSATPSDSNWNIKADLNHDGIINILDAVRASVHWNETW